MQSWNSDREGFDFDEWVALARDDPKAFEERRNALVREAIDQAPLHFQKKLHGLQFQVDMIRQRSTHPLGACVKISNLMLNHLYQQEFGRCEAQSDIQTARYSNKGYKNNLIPFPPGRRPL